MGAAAVIAVLVAAGELSSPVTTALRLAAQQSLGPAAAVHMLETPEPAAVDPFAVERSLGARTVAVVVWREPEHLHALLRVHVSGAARWTVREINFSPGDSLPERGRTLGLAISSAAPPLGPATAPAPSKDGPRGSVQRPAPAEPSGDRDISVAAPADTPGPKSWLRGRSLALGATAVVAVGLGGSDSSAGAAVEAALPIGGTVGLHLAGEMRTGPVAALSGTDLIALVGGGLEWWSAVGRRTGFGARTGVMVLRHQVTGHAMGLTETHTRTQPAAEIAGQLALRLSARMDLVFALGLELAFGSTDLRTGSTPAVVATIPLLRAISQLGLRVDL